MFERFFLGRSQNTRRGKAVPIGDNEFDEPFYDDELFDFDLTQDIFLPNRYIDYISNLYNIEFDLFSEFREVILPEHIENIYNNVYYVKIKINFTQK